MADEPPHEASEFRWTPPAASNRYEIGILSPQILSTYFADFLGITPTVLAQENVREGAQALGSPH